MRWIFDGFMIAEKRIVVPTGTRFDDGTPWARIGRRIDEPGQDAAVGTTQTSQFPRVVLGLSAERVRVEYPNQQITAFLAFDRAAAHCTATR